MYNCLTYKNTRFFIYTINLHLNLFVLYIYIYENHEGSKFSNSRDHNFLLPFVIIPKYVIHIYILVTAYLYRFF